MPFLATVRLLVRIDVLIEPDGLCARFEGAFCIKFTPKQFERDSSMWGVARSRRTRAYRRFEGWAVAESQPLARAKPVCSMEDRQGYVM